ncbi:MAG: transglutaminase-like domain-containing protein [Bacteroidales bacterium]|jgi:hypothetical protein|nr:transglutaminase-like domain-containing protein [Bacteroidales bacterium]
MQNEHKILLGLFGIGAIFGILKITQLANFAKLLSFSPKLNGNLKSIKISLTEVKIPLAVAIGNRTDQTMKVGVNAVEVFYKGKSMGITNPTTASATIQKYATTTITGIDLVLSLTSLIAVAGSAINNIITGGDFNTLLTDITLNVTCTYNDSVVFSINKIALGEEKQVNAQNHTRASMSGLGLVAASLRKIKPFADYEKFIPLKSALKNRDLICIPNGSVEDTVIFMQQIAKKCKADTAMLARQLKKSTVEKTLQAIFDFVYNYIQYVPDSATTEQVRRPLRTLYDRKGDCDCFSTLIASLLENLNIPYFFRIAAYNGKENYQHVYVVVPHNGVELVCDPVVDACFYEKPTSKHKDFA